MPRGTVEHVYYDEGNPVSTHLPKNRQCPDHAKCPFDDCPHIVPHVKNHDCIGTGGCKRCSELIIEDTAKYRVKDRNSSKRA